MINYSKVTGGDTGHVWVGERVSTNRKIGNENSIRQLSDPIAIGFKQFLNIRQL